MKKRTYINNLTEMNFSNDDKALVRACLKGDVKAQRSFYERFASKMLNICWRFSKSREAAEDLLQEGFFKVFCDLHQFKGTGSLEGWVRQVIVNVALQHVRRRKPIFFTELEVEKMDSGDNSYEQLHLQFEVEELLKMLQVLPEGCRVIFNLYVLEGYTHKEIAAELNITTGTSKSQLSKARTLLKVQFEKQKIWFNHEK